MVDSCSKATELVNCMSAQAPYQFIPEKYRVVDCQCPHGGLPCRTMWTVGELASEVVAANGDAIEDRGRHRSRSRTGWRQGGGRATCWSRGGAPESNLARRRSGPSQGGAPRWSRTSRGVARRRLGGPSQGGLKWRSRWLVSAGGRRAMEVVGLPAARGGGERHAAAPVTSRQRAGDLGEGRASRVA